MAVPDASPAAPPRNAVLPGWSTDTTPHSGRAAPLPAASAVVASAVVASAVVSAVVVSALVRVRGAARPR